MKFKSYINNMKLFSKSPKSQQYITHFSYFYQTQINFLIKVLHIISLLSMAIHSSVS